MQAIEAVFHLRPTNAANRLGDRLVCALNARDVQRSVDPMPVVVIEVACAALAPGILRAARHFDTVIGLSAPAHPMGEGPRPYALFQDLTAAADEADFWLPLFLKGGPVALQFGDEADVERAREQVFQLVDAGFTEVSLDASGLEPEVAAAAIAEASAPARERELSVEVVCPPSTDAIFALTRSLGGQAMAADVIALTQAPEPTQLDELQSVAGTAVVASPEAPHVAARRIFAGARFDRLLERLLPSTLRQQIERWRKRGSADLRQAFGHFHQELAQLDEGTRLRIEAMAYSEAMELLEGAGVRGSAPKSIEFLAVKSGY
jgi:hypothetical protein